MNETEENVLAREYNQIIQKAVEQLPPQRNLIYYLNREKGLNYQEIADHLAIPKHTVKNQLSTALQSIRLYLLKSAGSVRLIPYLGNESGRADNYRAAISLQPGLSGKDDLNGRVWWDQ